MNLFVSGGYLSGEDTREIGGLEGVMQVKMDIFVQDFLWWGHQRDRKKKVT